jgi:iron complex transport system ATP-binding protein
MNIIMSGTKPVVDIDHLHVRRGITILEDINWRVEKGQHWCILGANGSGKTTLLNALTGYFPATAGRVEVCGQEFGKYDWRELRKQIGLVSHHITQMMDRPLTARETVLSGKEAMLNYAVKGSTEDEAKALRILRQVQCEHLAE